MQMVGADEGLDDDGDRPVALVLADDEVGQQEVVPHPHGVEDRHRHRRLHALMRFFYNSEFYC